MNTLTEFEVINVVSKMSKLDKLLVWLQCIKIPSISVKNDFHVVVKTQENQKYWLNVFADRMSLISKGNVVNKKDRITDNLAIFYNNEYNYRCMSFEKFIREQSFLTDNGDDWQKNGFAQRMFLNLSVLDSIVYRNQEKYIK